METHETITAVQEMKHTLKEILNVLKGIKEDFKMVTTSADIMTTTQADEFQKVLVDIINNPVESKSPKKAKENVEAT